MKMNFFRMLLLGMATPVAWAASDAPIVDVYKSPTCGCCNKWIEHLEANGFTIRSHDTQNVVAHKARLGEPVGYGACNTA